MLLLLRHLANAVKIPEDGNVRHFNVDQMSEFLKEINTPDDVIKELKDIKFDGEALSHMTDRALQRYDLDNSVVRYFRDNSRTS